MNSMYWRSSAFFVALTCFGLALPVFSQSKNKDSISAVLQGGKEQSGRLAIVGGTLIDVKNYGRSANDISHSVVIVHDGKVETVGTLGELRIPAGSQTIDATGMYIIPGLIDGFGALRTRGFANAYLYEGITTVYVQLSPAGEDGEQALIHASPGPDILRGTMIGGYSADGTPSHEHPWTKRRLDEVRLTSQELVSRVDQAALTGYSGLLIGLDVWPDQMDTILREARSRGLATIGEMAFTSYPYAVRGGITALMRSDRYQTAIDLAQDYLAYSDDPEGPGGAAGYRGVCQADTTSAAVSAFGKQLQASSTALMPILSIEAAADDLNIPNPWSDRTAEFVHPQELDDPVDPKTGAHPYLASHTQEKQRALRQCAFHREDLDGKFYQLGAHFLAASGSPAFGILPGAGLHLELSLLQRIGLAPREALAAATANYSEVYGWHDRGLIEPGRRADLLLLSADPRVDVASVRKIKYVILAGHIIDREELYRAARGPSQ
jgi:Amidohydrolase family